MLQLCVYIFMGTEPLDNTSKLTNIPISNFMCPTTQPSSWQSHHNLISCFLSWPLLVKAVAPLMPWRCGHFTLPLGPACHHVGYGYDFTLVTDLMARTGNRGNPRGRIFLSCKEEISVSSWCKRGRQVLSLNRSVMTTCADAEGETLGEYGGLIFSDVLTQIFSFHETEPHSSQLEFQWCHSRPT